MSKELEQELTDLEQREIAHQIESGITSGILDDEESRPIYRLLWRLETDKFKL